MFDGSQARFLQFTNTKLDRSEISNPVVSANGQLNLLKYDILHVCTRNRDCENRWKDEQGGVPFSHYDKANAVYR